MLGLVRIAREHVVEQPIEVYGFGENVSFKLHNVIVDLAMGPFETTTRFILTLAVWKAMVSINIMDAPHLSPIPQDHLQRQESNEKHLNNLTKTMKHISWRQSSLMNLQRMEE